MIIVTIVGLMEMGGEHCIPFQSPLLFSMQSISFCPFYCNANLRLLWTDREIAGLCTYNFNLQLPIPVCIDSSPPAQKDSAAGYACRISMFNKVQYGAYVAMQCLLIIPPSFLALVQVNTFPAPVLAQSSNPLIKGLLT